jgi:hypothetical protein
LDFLLPAAQARQSVRHRGGKPCVSASSYDPTQARTERQTSRLDIAVNRPVDVVMAISEQKYVRERIGLAHAGRYWTLVQCHGERQSINYGLDVFSP